MKLYSKISLYTLGIAVALSATSCGSDSKGGSDGPANTGTKISIQTEVITKTPAQTDFSQGQKMNVYVKKNATAQGDDYLTGVSATSNGGGQWTLSPEIYLNETQKNLFFFCAYPYVEGATNVLAYPVDLSLQQDVMYSGDYVPVSLTSTVAKIRMKPALSMASLIIDASNYSGAGVMTSLGISGSSIYTKGTMDVSKGKIKTTDADKGVVSKDMSFDIKGNGSANLWVIPFSTKTSDAAFNITIDGKNYIVDVPEVEMNTGFQYVFHLILTANGLVIRPDAIEEISLNLEGDVSDKAEGYGSILFTTTATEFAFPIFSGENVFGNVVCGGTSVNYSLDGSMTLSGSGSKTVNVESWNSTGFEISNMKDIQSIDISNY